MDTKVKGDISEQAVVYEALKQGWEVLKPFGDRLPYDLVIDVNGILVKIQVKSAWLVDETDEDVWGVETRRTKTNRREMKRTYYQITDCDFVVVHAQKPEVFWILPIEFYLTFKGQITLRVNDNGQRLLKSSEFRNDWNLISKWASEKETFQRNFVKFGETCNVAIPSQACSKEQEGVET